MRRPWLLAAALAAAAVAVAAVALVADNGSSGDETAAGFPNFPSGRKPVVFDIGGMVFDPQPGVREAALTQAHALGADALRVLVQWNLVTPASKPPDFHPADPRDPNYNLSVYDDTISEAAKKGLKIILMPTGPAPEWAARPNTGGLADPDPRQFGNFVSALAKRYNGHFDPDGNGPAGTLPKIDIWTIWNEPNLSTLPATAVPGRAPLLAVALSRLYLAAQAAVQAAATAGADADRRDRADRRMSSRSDPLTFTAPAALPERRLPEAGPTARRGREQIDADRLVARHPYPLAASRRLSRRRPRLRDHARWPALEATPRSAAADAGRLPLGLPVYITEFGVQSLPDPNAVTPQQQAADIEHRREPRLRDPRLRTLRSVPALDDPPDHVPGELYGGFESGLRFSTAARSRPTAPSACRSRSSRQGGRSRSGVSSGPPGRRSSADRSSPGGGGRGLQTPSGRTFGISRLAYGVSPGRAAAAVGAYRFGRLAGILRTRPDQP